ncbi:SGNH/GDSL hydrolase family protein [Leifsonia shinshuensis]|uniref:Lysophospholipase L1-like esterase n=1 Tax=Leifsonia shinshuensis TaxID=150026 RepID=A0A853CZU5_9MICO|nr:SGNH/GDSL hydrolase family protein [Leifsonia shinshuensis]NYJ24684.1 lysophospholipase L1-like esterase [Leifsonia shinshuensis]
MSDGWGSGHGTLALVGDSLTQGGDWAAWLPGEDVLNLGVAGDTSDDVLARLGQIVEARPATVALLIGTNDLAWRRSVEHVVRNVETILVTLRKELPEARILVQSVLPRGREFADQIRDINRHLWQFAPTVHAAWLDLWPAMALEGGELNPAYTDDRLHLNEEGYRVWLSELVPGLERARQLPPNSRAIQLPDLGGAA